MKRNIGIFLFIVLVGTFVMPSLVRALQDPETVAIPSAYLNPDNAFIAANPPPNNVINLPAAATLVPATTTSPASDFYFVQCFRTNETPNFAAGTNETLISNANLLAGTGGSDRSLTWYTFGSNNYNAGNAGKLSISAKVSGQQWWQGTTPTSIAVRPNKVGCLVGGQIGTQQFLAADDNTGTPFTGSPSVATSSNMGSTGFYNLNGVFRGQSTIGSLFNEIGGITQSAGFRNNWGGSVGEFAFYWGTFPNSGGTPDAGTVAAIANGTEAFSSLPGTCRYHLPMSDATSTTLTPDPNCVVTTVASTSGTVVPGSPVRMPPAISLNERGDGYVFRATPGMTGPGATGTIYISGTYADDGGGLPTGIDARIEDANGNPINTCSGNCDWQTIVNSPTGGTFSGMITGVPVGGPYYVAVRYTNSPIRAYHSEERSYVGLVIVTDGQSQMNGLWSNTAPNLTISGSNDSVVTIPNLRDSAPPTNTPYGSPAIRPLSAISMPGNANNYVGNGVATIINSLNTLSGGWPIMVANFAKSGTPIDAWAFDRAAAGPKTLSGSGTTYTGSLVFVPTPPAQVVYGIGFAVYRGTVNVYEDGTLVAVDSNSSGNTGTLIAQNGSGVTGTINYYTDAISVVFPSTPDAAPTVTWNASADSVVNSYILNNPLTNFTVFGDGTPTSGVDSAIWSRINAPASAFIWMQGTSNESEFAATSTWATGEASYLAKLNLLKSQLAELSNYDPSTPFIIATHPRSGEGNTATEFVKKTGIRKAQYDISAPGNSNGYTFGGIYTDDTLIGGTGPNEDDTSSGTDRIGRRMAVAIWGTQGGSTTAVRGPEASSATFVYGSNNSQIDVKFNLYGGTALANVSSTTSNLQGFRVGVQNGTMYYDDGLTPDVSGAPVFAPDQTFTAALVATDTVRLTKATGFWNASSSVDYEYGAPFYRNGSALSLSVVGGTGYTNGGPYTLTFSGGGCTTEPTGTVYVVGNSLTNAQLSVAGIACTSVPTVSISGAAGSGTGGSITPIMATPSSDAADMSTLLYDNRGGFAGNEPGIPALPIFSPMTVSYASQNQADITSPIVSVTAPTASTTVSGLYTLTASSTDDVAVAGVTFYVDGTAQGSEATSSTTIFSTTWDSTMSSDGTHSIFAVSRDTSNNFATSTSVAVTVNNNAPVISGLATSTAQTSATISWNTDTPASTILNYGVTSRYDSATSSPALATSHSFVLQGLSPSTQYHFQIISTDNYGLTSTSSDYTFTTASLPVVPPTVTIQAASNITSTSATLNGMITSSGNASSTIEGFNFGTTVSYGMSTSTPAVLSVGSFNDGITGLAPATTYHVQAFATNGGGTGTSTDQVFTTAAPGFSDVTPPVVAVTFPPANAVLINGANLTASSSDDTGVAGVTFYVDGVKQGNEVTSPNTSYAYTWNSNAVSNGSHSVFAVARDTSNNFATSSPVIFSVIPYSQHGESGQSIIAPSSISSNNSGVVTTVTTSTVTLPIFTRDLQLGSRGSDVVDLQNLLISLQKGPAANALAAVGATGYFGAYTKLAVIELQKALFVQPTSGYFGPLTRAALQAVYGR